jgi:hypothetical protein
MENQRCHPTSSTKNSTRSQGESGQTSTAVATTAASNQRCDLRYSTQTSSKRQRKAEDNMANSQITHSRSKKSKTTPPREASSFKFTSLPFEIRRMILHHVLTSAAGPRATISTHPRSQNLPEPPAAPAMLLFHGPQQTQWHARRGLLYASSALRDETLQVLYGDFAFFARMTLGHDLGFDGKGRFERWLEASGSEESVERVRRVAFRVEWPAVRRSGGKRWYREKTEIEISVFRGKGRVRAKVEVEPTPWWRQEAEATCTKVEEVEVFVNGILSSKGDGVGLASKEWIKVWEKVEEVMRLQLHPREV